LAKKQIQKVFLDPTLMESARIDLVECAKQRMAEDQWHYEGADILLCKDSDCKHVPGQELLELKFTRFVNA